MQVLWGIGGLAAILALAFLLSTNRRAINPRTVLGALAIQVSFGVVVLFWDFGRRALELMTTAVQAVIDSSAAGIGFLFGGMLQAEGAGFVFAFQVLPVIIFFASLMGTLYYLGLLQRVVAVIGGAIQRVLQTSKAESMSASANIFVGQTEAPLVVRPYIAEMTRSELFAVMTGGLSTVAGSVLIGYALLGVPLEYLIAASFMAAPAGLLMAKMIMPETQEPSTKGEVSLKMAEDRESAPSNVIDAAARGASDGLRLALNVGAMLIAFISLIALFNLILGALGTAVGYEELTFELLIGYVFAPVAFIIGVPWEEAVHAGSFLGQKLVLNEFVAYANFAPEIEAFSAKTAAIISFALCGFANFGSLAILLGGLGGIAPTRRGEIAKYGLRAIAAATLANLSSGAIAGMLIS